MKLNLLLDEIKILDTINYKPNLDIKGISYHSSYIKDSYLFVAIKGYKTDGHKYIKDAMDKGAIAVILEEFDPSINLPQLKVQDSRKALASLQNP